MLMQTLVLLSHLTMCKLMPFFELVEGIFFFFFRNISMLVKKGARLVCSVHWTISRQESHLPPPFTFTCVCYCAFTCVFVQVYMCFLAEPTYLFFSCILILLHHFVLGRNNVFRHAFCSFHTYKLALCWESHITLSQRKLAYFDVCCCAEQRIQSWGEAFNAAHSFVACYLTVVTKLCPVWLHNLCNWF